MLSPFHFAILFDLGENMITELFNKLLADGTMGKHEGSYGHVRSGISDQLRGLVS